MDKEKSEKCFQDSLEYWVENNNKNKKFWNDFAIKWNFVSGDAARSWSKRNREKLSVTRENARLFLGDCESVIHNEKIVSPKVGVLDIESLPLVCYSFEMYNVNIGIEQVISEICLLSWSGKFLNEPDIYSDILTAEEAPKKDMERIVKSCWDFMSKCEVIIGHNFASFDGKMMNTFFLKFGLPPLKYVIVDTLLVARNNFRFSSNKLSFINRELGIRDKISNEGFRLWRLCHEGDQTSLNNMKDYNIGDIYSTEQLFYKVRPYVKNFNVALYNEIDEYQCPVCGSEKLKSNGFYYTNAGKYESILCEDCNCVSRKKQNLLDKDKKKSLLVNS